MFLYLEIQPSTMQLSFGHRTDSDDVKNVDLTKVHNLSGPVAVEGAEPGDCLVVDILDVTPFEKMPWGYTVRKS